MQNNIATPSAAATDQADAVAEVEIDAAELWESWETQLVKWSIGIGVAGLAVFGLLINVYLLP